MREPRKDDWWRPVWVGLVADADGKHIRHLGTAGWLLFYLIVHADPATGVVNSYTSTIAARMGMPLRTVQRWLRLLSIDHYIVVTSTEHAPHIRVLRWKSLVTRAKTVA